MVLIALRPEYQLSVDPAKNRIFYQNFGPMQHAQALPHYFSDWAAALAAVRPGFNMLSDMQVVNQSNQDLIPGFQHVERLIVNRGIRILAEVHMPGLSTRSFSDDITSDKVMPVRRFLSVWEAMQFLDEPA